MHCCASIKKSLPVLIIIHMQGVRNLDFLISISFFLRQLKKKSSSFKKIQHTTHTPYIESPPPHTIHTKPSLYTYTDRITHTHTHSTASSIDSYISHPQSTHTYTTHTGTFLLNKLLYFHIGNRVNFNVRSV